MGGYRGVVEASIGVGWQEGRTKGDRLVRVDGDDGVKAFPVQLRLVW